MIASSLSKLYQRQAFLLDRTMIDIEPVHRAIKFGTDGHRGYAQIEWETSRIKNHHVEGLPVSGGPLQDIPNVSCTRFLCQRMLQRREQTCMIDGATGRSFTYGQTFQMVKRATRWFAQHTNPGDVVLIYASNRPHYVTSFLAVAAMGSVVAHVSAESTFDELQSLLQTLGGKVSVILAEKDNVENALKVSRDSGQRIRVIVFTDGLDAILPETVLSFEEDLLEGWTEEAQVLEDAFAHQPSTDYKKRVLHILSSSGTTGLPKRVLVSHYARLANIIQLSDPRFRFCESKRNRPEILLLLMPMHLMFATVLWTHALAEGAVVVTLPKFKPVSFLSALRDHRVTLLPVVPPLALFLIESPLTDKYGLTSLRKVLSAGAPMPPSLAEVLRIKLNLESYRQGYGMTEAGHVTNVTNGKSNPSSIGSVFPGTEIQVCDLQSGRPVGPNQLGEFRIRGPQLMTGYMDLPSVFDHNGWLRSGDVGYYDQEGEFFFVERIKDVLKVKGHQVAPAELEALISKHESVSDCAVIGVSDPRAGELPLAFVVLVDPRLEVEDTARDIQRFVASRTSRIKHLTGGVRFVEAIPRTSSGKIMRAALRRRLLESKRDEA